MRKVVRKMKYDSYDEYFYFLLGASISSGREFWVGENTETNKSIKNENTTVTLNNNTDTVTIKVGV